MTARRPLILITLSIVASSCGSIPQKHLYPWFEQGQWYLCCTTRFNDDGDANDGGYNHENGTTLPAGTVVKVIGDEKHTLVIQPVGSQQHYFLKYRFGRLRKSADDYFRLILLDHDPRANLTPEIAAAIATGRPAIGMTREEVIMARGYPPLHRTPDLKADRWVYFETGDDTMLVDFVDGRLTATTPGKADDLP